MIVYKITNLINNKIYIGQTCKSIQDRWRSHLIKSNYNTKMHLYNAIRLYGENNFRIESLEECSSKADLNTREIYWIDRLKSTDRTIGYNTHMGGTGGAQPLSIAKASGIKAAKTRKARNYKPSKETISKMSRAHLGKIISNDQRLKISNTLKGRTTNDSFKRLNKIQFGIHHPMYGKTHSEEAKSKLSKARKGKRLKDILSSEKYDNFMKSRARGARNRWYISVDRDQLLNLVLDPNLFLYEVADRLNLCRTTVLSKCKELFNKTFNEIRKENSIIVTKKRIWKNRKQYGMESI